MSSWYKPNAQPIFKSHQFATMRRLPGTLMVKHVGQQVPLVYLNHAGKSSILSKRQMAADLSSMALTFPEMLQGAHVNYLLEGGQPTSVSLIRSPPGQKDSRRSAELLVGGVTEYNSGRGRIHFRAYEEFSFDKFEIAISGWVPKRGDPVTFIPRPAKTGKNAIQVAPLSACEDARIIDTCVNSSWEWLFWEPFLSRFLQSLSHLNQIRWITSNKEKLSRGTKSQWWRALDPDVVASPSILGGLPEHAVAEAVKDELKRVCREDPETQLAWLEERRAFAPLFSREQFSAFHSRVLWMEEYWNLLGPPEKARSLLALITTLDVGELVARLDNKICQHLVPDAEPMVLAILKESEGSGRAFPEAWQLIAETISNFASSVPDKLWTTNAIVGAIACFPEVSKLVPEKVLQAAPLLHAVGSFAAFKLSSPAPLTGSTKFDQLKPEDWLLAAVYSSAEHRFGEKVSRHFGRLTRAEDWTWQNLNTMSNYTEETRHFWADFLVRGVQPRLAELAFAEVHKSLDLGDRLEDINLRVIKTLGELSLASAFNAFRVYGRDLSEDWSDRQMSYDVKSNLYFRAKKKSVGMRGFVVEVDKEARAVNVTLPGFVFFDSSETQAAWSFIGFLDAKELAVEGRWSKRRVAPFYFSLPSRHRLAPGEFADKSILTSLCELLITARPLLDPQLGAEMLPAVIPLLVGAASSSPSHLSLVERLFCSSIETARRRLQKTDEDTPRLERVLWEGLTLMVFSSRSSGHPEGVVAEALSYAASLFENRWFPLVLPRVESRPLISRWIKDVLGPLNSCWESISCPNCDARGNSIRIEPQTISSDLATSGTLSCECGYKSNNITLLTHCHACNQYPLIIGQNEVCEMCHGLICSNRNCRRCKKTCSRSGSAW